MSDLHSTCIEAIQTIYEKEFPCVCTPEYADRGIIAPNCDNHVAADVADDMLDALLGVLEEHADEWAEATKTHPWYATAGEAESLLAVLREDT